MSEDPRFGYSQKSPGGRWGPDFDCSSFVYFVADAVGYPVGIGNQDGKVRFTGTMGKDFKDAGFQLLPFANVGLGDLEVGDILLNLAVHAEIYVGEGQMVGAMASEKGTYVGEPGDQTGGEISKHPAYIHKDGWDYVLRPPVEEYIDVEGHDPDDDEEEGEDEMAYPYSNTTMGGGSWMPQTTAPGMPRTTVPNWMPPQNMNYGGYPQGNIGQLNGYSSAGGYQTNGQGQQMWPQGGQQRQLTHVKDLNEVRDIHVGPNEAIVVFLGEGHHMAIKSADQEGFPSIRVFELRECSEDMPQRNWMPMMGMEDNAQNGYSGQQEHMGMQQVQGVSRQEFDQLKEMIANVQSAISGYPQGAMVADATAGNADASATNGTTRQSGGQSGSNTSARNGRNA